MTKIFKFKTIILLSVFYFLLFVLPAQAARLYFEPQEAIMGAEKDFSVGVRIDAENQINAISGGIKIPAEIALI